MAKEPYISPKRQFQEKQIKIKTRETGQHDSDLDQNNAKKQWTLELIGASTPSNDLKRNQIHRKDTEKITIIPSKKHSKRAAPIARHFEGAKNTSIESPSLPIRKYTMNDLDIPKPVIKPLSK